ncbi:MFS transporter [Phenylobacterium sp.]|uniref:MFS transporter n=1 Tax=Phenylobacterium sp. TaxID=1871053 RepID=UPI0025F9085E|nr:MFS transporter [Phenylobacterium sp.]
MSTAFQRLWAAQAISAFGARITREGLPIMAVITLGAQASTLGPLAAVASGAALLAAMAGGPFVDRARRRPVLIWADLLRAALLASIPLAAVLGALDLPQVFAVVALTGAISAIFEMASHAYLPTLVERGGLVAANSRLAATDATAEVGGPALAGLLFQWLSAPIAVAVNSATYVASALWLATIRAPEPGPVKGLREHWVREFTAGLRIAWTDRRVRPLLAMASAQGLFGGVFSALYVLFAIRTLGLSPSMLGLAIAAGGAGALAGAALAPRLARRLGHGPAILTAMTGAGLAVLITPFAPASPTAGLATLVVSQLVGDALAVAGAVLAASLRQALVPQAALGRVSGAFLAGPGAMAVVGALGGGALGAAIGPRAALLIAALGFVVLPLIGALSPLRDLREIDAVD